jgi:hypothetical protein
MARVDVAERDVMTVGATPGLGQTFAANVPICFLPFRLETRFVLDATGASVLMVRIYPDQIAIDSHQDALTAQEIADGQVYWNAIWRAGTTSPPKSALQGPWQALVGNHGAPRSAWIRSQMTPTNLASQPAASTAAGATPNPAPQFPSPQTQTTSWPNQAQVAALPDYWTVVGYVDGAVTKVATGSPVKGPLTVGLPPSGDKLALDIPGNESMRWMFDFPTALGVGMGVQIPLSAAETTRGFDRLIAYGVRTPAPSGEQMLATLLQHHQHTDGLSWVPQGSPTNNNEGDPSAFTTSDPNCDISFAVECGPPLTTDPTCDAALAAPWLGVPLGTFDHVRFSDRKEQAASRAMAKALFPATLGYFLVNMLAVSDSDMRAARGYFLNNVYPRGPLPAFRVGATPYVYLPVTSIQLLSADAAVAASFDKRFLGAISGLLPGFQQGYKSTPRIGRTADFDNDLVSVLGVDASSSTYVARPLVGTTFYWNLIGFLGAPVTLKDIWLEKLVAATRALLTAMGIYPSPFPPAGVHPPKLALNIPADTTTPIAPWPHATVFDGPLSETAPLPNDTVLADGSPGNYIKWLRGAPIMQLEVWGYPTKPMPQVLLFRLLRQSLLMEYYNQAARVQVKNGSLLASQTVEPELVHLGPDVVVTRWEALARQVPGQAAGTTWQTYLTQAGVSTSGAMPELADLQSALDFLATVPTAELDRLVTETLDVCSHRLDAAITSVACALLPKAAPPPAAAAPKRYLGGYAWVENLKPRGTQPAAITSQDKEHPAVARLDVARGAEVPGYVPTQVFHADTGNGGYILAPSPAQATTAAILRSAWLAHQQSSGGQIGVIDLGSKRVRQALWILEGIAQGESLGGLLGYSFEQELLQLGRSYQDAFRKKYQLVDLQITPGQPGQKVAASGIVNGSALLQAWRAGAIPWGEGDLPGGADQATVDAILKALDDSVSAIGDLSLAEGVFQLVNGNPGRAGAILDAISRGTRPPDPQVMRTPRAGVDVTHRLVVLMATDQTPTGNWASVTKHPRSQLEPRLDAWASGLLPDPKRVRAYLSFTDGSGTARTVPVLLADLDVGPLDFLAMAHASRKPAAGEIEQRILYARLPAGATAPTIRFDLDPKVDAGFISVPDAVTAARAIRELLDGARALLPKDLIDVSQTPGTFDGNLDENALAATLISAGTLLQTAISNLQAAATASDISAALLAASSFGVTGSIPSSPSEDLTRLQARQSAVGAELTKRGTALATIAASATATVDDKVAAVRDVFQGTLNCLPRFSAPDSANLVSAFNASSAVLRGATDALGFWFQQLTHVRPAVSRLDMALTYGQALAGTLRPTLTVGQLPFRAGDHWVGLPLDPAKGAPPPGTVSLAAIVQGDYTQGKAFAGLVIDEWSERIPVPNHSAGLTFQYSAPNSVAPQAILLAICPDAAARVYWDDTAILAVLSETFNLAQIRAVDLANVAQLGQALPTLVFPDSALASFSLGIQESST